MSLTVIKHIICELTGYRPGTVDVSQGDRGSRAVSCRLMENGAPWMIPDGATARVAYTLPDGTEGLYDRRPDGSPMWEISKNIVTVELADQLMAQAGMVQMSILILGPEGGQLATWPIRVMVSADSPARLTVPEAMPPYGAGFAGKIFFGGEDGTVTPLDIGDGVEIVLQEDGTFALVAYGGGGGGGGITEEKDPTVYAWAKQPQKPTYTAQEVGAMPAGTKIPGKTSELTNDAGFVNKAVNDLANYYTKVQTQALIAAIPRFRVTVVQQLPAAGEELVLYLVPFATAEGQYLEYIWVDGRWEIIGSQRVDLTGYATEVWVKDYVAEHPGQNDNLIGYAKEAWVQERFQPKGNYLTSAPVTDVNGKTGSVQLGAADVGARPDTWVPTAHEVGALPNTYTPPDQTAEQVGADPEGAAAAAMSGHNASNDAHPDIRLEIKAIREQLAAFLDVDEETLNELSELIARIVANQTSIEQLTTGKVNVADIIDNLTTNVANKPLSAAQGVVIKGLIDGLSSGKLDASKLTEAINTALAQAKANGEFDGAKGDPGRGIKSIARTSGNGAAGTTDTYTIAYTDGTTSTFTVHNGSNGAPGQAATLEITDVTALLPGAAPTITEASDSTAQARRYALGIPAGAPGETPVYGVDYSTPAQIEEIVQQVVVALGTPVFGRVDADKNITLSTEHLTSGTYKIGYDDKDGNWVLIGTLNHTVAPSGPVEIPLVWEHGAVLDKNTGKVSQTGSANYSASDYTSIDPTKSYTLKRDSYIHNTCNVIWCDASKNFIRYDTMDFASINPNVGGTGDLERQLNPPANAAYIRLRLWYESDQTATTVAAMYHLIEG